MEIPKEIMDKIEAEAKNRYGQLYGLSKGVWTADEMLKNIEGAFSAGARWVHEQLALASLSTDAENYWKQRCEAAEELISFWPPNYLSPDHRDKYRAWQQLKSTPLPNKPNL